jgi:hypothetical protein
LAIGSLVSLFVVEAGLVSRDFQFSSDLLRHSACIQQGAILVSGLSADINVATTVSLPRSEWIPESGTAPAAGDPAHVLHPRIVAASVTCSEQLLVQSPQAEAIVKIKLVIAREHETLGRFEVPMALGIGWHMPTITLSVAPGRLYKFGVMSPGKLGPTRGR